MGLCFNHCSMYSREMHTVLQADCCGRLAVLSTIGDKTELGQRLLPLLDLPAARCTQPRPGSIPIRCSCDACSGSRSPSPGRRLGRGGAAAYW